MPPRDKYSEAQMEQLTEEERAGLEEELAEQAEAAGDDDDDENGAAEGDKAEAGVTVTPPAAADKPTAAADSDKTVTDPPKPAPGTVEAPAPDTSAPAPAPTTAAPPPSAVVPRWEAPKDAKAQQDAIDTARAALSTKFEDGDLTSAEFQQQNRAIDGQQRTLDKAVLKGEISSEMSQEAWFQRDVPSFFGAHPEYASGAMQQVLDLEVRKLQVAAATAGTSQFDPAILATAHSNITADLAKAGLTRTGVKPSPKTAEEKRPDLPPTLAHAPAADTTAAADGGEFGFLDRLADKDGEAYEAALEKLTPEARDRYLQG